MILVVVVVVVAVRVAIIDFLVWYCFRCSCCCRVIGFVRRIVVVDVAVVVIVVVVCWCWMLLGLLLFLLCLLFFPRLLLFVSYCCHWCGCCFV